jgi:amino acid adenylation domain-containing protein/non-ribosomal peptide synthase protein (TIGR01720 family)
LSYAQERLWFLDQLMPGNTFYNVDNALRVSFPYNIAALEWALNEIVRRHEALRTTFTTVDGQPVQVISPALSLSLPVIDLLGLPEPEREAEALRLATEEAQRPFDLAQGPLVRTTILRLGEADYVFLLTMHHIVSDGWSMKVFFSELIALYSAFCMGKPSPLPELPIQYADFAVWQREWLQGGVLEAQLAYWKQQLADLPVLQLPTDRPRPVVQTFQGACLSMTLPERLTAALKALSQREGGTLFMTFLAAFQTLLLRYTGKDDIVVGAPIANRNRAEIEGLIGFFVNSLVLRTDLSGDPSFREALSRVREVALGAYAHEDLPFEKLVEELQPERNMGRNPLYQTSLQYFSVLDSTKTAPRINIDKGTAGIDLAFDLLESPEGLVVEIEYSTDLFDATTVSRMAGHFQTLLEGIVANPGQRLSELPLLTETERQHLLVDWNGSVIGYPQDRRIHELFEAQVAQTPDEIAVIRGDDQLTYRELNRRANQLAHHLQSLGVGPEGLVAICIERSIEMIVGLLGILKAGGAYVPVDPAYPKERLAFMLEDTQAHVLLTQQRLVAGLPPHGAPRLCLDTDWEIVAQASDANPVSGVTDANLAYVIYTSGSTGAPKGVMIEHRAICNHLRWMQSTFPLTESDRTLLKYSFSFDASILEIFCPLLVGARLIITEPGGHVDSEYLVQLLVEQEVTALDLVPSMLQVLLEDKTFRTCRSLRRITCGGEAMPVELMEELLQWLDVEFTNMYGLTEATISSTFWTSRIRGNRQRTVPIGRPVANTQIYVLDARLNPVPIGVPGELYIGGDGVARGYLNRPDLTGEKFIPDPFVREPDARLYHTGDLARYLADGNIEYLGRVDQQVKIRGFRIELGEIETVLLQHSSVEACSVAALEDKPGPTRLVAYIVPTTDKPELWPTVGEYFIYDELLYYAMTHDERRNRSYRVAINRLVTGQTIVDIGTGADAILARFCVEAGAERVYAIEMIEEAYNSAKNLITSLGMHDKIILIHGDSTEVHLPEKVDVCVSELIGTIGSSEGVAVILNDARRFLKDDGIMIPYRSTTRIAAVSLPEELAVRPRFTELSKHYTEKIFQSVGYPFDIRVCIKNFPKENIVSESQVFEDLDFTDYVQPEYQSEITLTITKNCRLDGFLLWLNLYPIQDELIDVLNHEYSWLPTFFPVFDGGVEVLEGDIVRAVCSVVLSDNRLTPDYRIKGSVIRQSNATLEFDYYSFYHKRSFKATPFYAALFAESFEGRHSHMLDAGRAAQQISRWREIYDQIYSQTSPPNDPMFNIIGWDSSYTGMPIPAEEMREQVNRTVERVLALQPSRVLEIGCGTGLLLFRIAPHCSHYCGTDFSPVALHYVQEQLTMSPLSQVRLLQRTADNFEDMEAGTFDAVILNSVVQYFPSIDYLVRVLEEAVRVISPGGYIFLGDVRSLPLLEAFHTSVELHRAHASRSTRELRERVHRRMKQEQELVLDPAFFTALQQHLPQIRHVEMQPKRGWHHNELTRFRYDVLLQVGGEVSELASPPLLEWSQVASFAAVRQLLRETEPEVLGITGVPNGRLQAEVKTLELLTSPNGPETVGEIRTAVGRQEATGVEPETLWALGEELPYEVHIGWAGAGVEGRYDVLFRRRTSAWAARLNGSVTGATTRREPWSTYANNPLDREFAQGLVPALQSFLREQLPEYMVPSAFVVLEALPLMPNGKVDRHALPAPNQARPELEASYVAPINSVEKLLAEIWAQALGLERVGIHDNFFALGGDSILSVQVIARAKKAGLQLTLNQLFQNQTIAGLAAVAGTIPTIQADQGVVLGQVLLTPIQQWFFEQDFLDSHHSNQAILLEVQQALDPALLVRVVRHLLGHHDALRLRFMWGESGWQQFHAVPDETPPFSQLDLSALSELEQRGQIEASAAEIQASLNLSEGPLLRVVLFDLGASKPSRLLLVIHHLVVDGISWRIFMEDLWTAYGQLSLGEGVQLPPKTTSFQRWAQRLTEYARSEALQHELDYWLGASGTRVFHLPTDYTGGSNTVASTRIVSVSLSLEETRALLQEVPNAYRTLINDVLLTALAQAFAKWTGEQALLIDLEGHGREALFDDVDVSRTIGWFTTLFPVLLDLEGVTHPGEALKSVKEQLRRIPNRGIGYGALRYLSHDAQVVEKLQALPRAEINFNYLGQFGYAASNPSPIRAAQESCGAMNSPRAHRSYLLELNGSISQGRFQLDWMYSENVHRSSTIEGLAQDFLEALQLLIAHCQSPEAGGYTPSDFSKAKLSQKALDRLIAKISQSSRRRSP